MSDIPFICFTVCCSQVGDGGQLKTKPIRLILMDDTVLCCKVGFKYVEFMFRVIYNCQFAHGAMGRRIDPSWGGPIELFLVPVSVPRLV